MRFDCNRLHENFMNMTSCFRRRVVSGNTEMQMARIILIGQEANSPKITLPNFNYFEGILIIYFTGPDTTHYFRSRVPAARYSNTLTSAPR